MTDQEREEFLEYLDDYQNIEWYCTNKELAEEVLKWYDDFLEYKAMEKKIRDSKRELRK